MKKTLVAVMAVALILSMLCGQALASSGDFTVKDAKAYSDPAMKNYIGTIPANTALVVRDYDSYVDVYVDGRIVYIDGSTLLRKSLSAKYTGTLSKGTRVYQRADTDAVSYRLKKSISVKICKVSGDWALIQSTGKRGLYAFVQVDKLSDIKVN